MPASTAARKTAPPATPEIVVETPQQALATLAPKDVIDGVSTFLKGLVPFVKQALELEKTAKQRLAEAKRFTAPQSADEDAKLQQHIKDSAAAKRGTEAHWQTITSTLHGLHRRMTARRDVAVKALEEAQSIPNRLHNAYVEAERRKANEENERRWREEARLAEERRAAELDEIERQAMAREAASADLSERELAFVDAYVGGIGTQGDGQASAKRAGYKDPFAQAARLLGSEKIRSAVQGRLDAIRLREQAAAKSEAPLELREVEEVKADVASVGTDVTRWKAEVLDEVLFIAAVCSGKHGIPQDVLQVNPAKLNEYARSLRGQLNRWPGVRAVSTTKLQ